METSRKRQLFAVLWCLLCAAAALAVCSRSSPLYPTNDWGDANIYFTIGRGMLEGLVPYRDLLDHKGPLLYFLHAAAALVSDSSFFGVWLWEVAAGAAFLWFSLKSVSLFCPEHLSLLTVPLVAGVVYSSPAFAQGDSAEELCLPLLAFSLWCLLRAFKAEGAVRPGLWLVFADGLAAGAVFWVKYTLLGLHFAWMACLAFWLWLGEKSFSSALKACGAFLGGMAAVSVPVLAYFAFHNSLGDLFGTYFVTNFTSYSDAPSNWTVPFYNMAVSGLSTLTSNPVWMGLALLGGAWLIFAPRLLTGAGRAALAAMAFFTAFFIWCGSMGWPYYGLPLAVFAPLGFVPLLSLLRRLPLRFEAPRLAAAGCAVCLVASLALEALASPNVSFMALKKEDLVQTKFAAIIQAEGGESLLNYGFLDGGFYLSSGILPSCRFFCRTNLSNWEELEQPVRQMVAENAFDFIVTREEGALYEMEGYELVCTEYQEYDGVLQPYSLFRAKG